MKSELMDKRVNDCAFYKKHCVILFSTWEANDYTVARII